MRKEIVETAKKLFNELGYSSVSMRNIADDLGISVGNLTYYFKRKEALIEEVLVERQKLLNDSQAPQNLQELNQLFKYIVHQQQENKYNFRHVTQLAQISAKIYETQLKAFQSFHTFIYQAIKNLQKNRLIKEEEIPGQLDGLVQSLLIISIYWVPPGAVPAKAEFRTNHLNCLWSLLFSVLTDEGKQTYKEVIQRENQAYSGQEKRTG